MLQFFENFLNASSVKGILVARLRSREYVEVVAVLVLDQPLGQCCFAVDNVDQVIDHAAFAAR